MTTVPGLWQQHILGCQWMSRDITTHVELLIDAGHAQWKDPKGVARITNAGYDFIDAVEKPERVRTKFLERFKAGIAYLMAVQEALDVLNASLRARQGPAPR